MSVESQTTKKLFLTRKFAQNTKHAKTVYKAQPKYYKPIQKCFLIDLHKDRQSLIFTVANFWPHVGKKCALPNPDF